MFELGNFETIAIFSGSAVLTIFVIGGIFAKLYQRASKETAYVRTGLGGQSIVMDGGSIVLPVVHEIIPVNMNTLRLEVRRTDQQALITRDRMRVDVQAEFYVRVQPTEESIANAAQTLGRRTMHPDALKELIEGKFVDALRSVAAEMAMEELHEKRVDFVQKVQIAVSEDLLKNGLELESVSLTGLDQTSLEHLNPENAFDAQGLTLLTQQIEMRKKERNDIEQDTMVKIKQKNLEAERLKLEITKQEEGARFEQQREIEYSRLEQEREVEVRRAAQNAEIKRERAQKEQEAEDVAIFTKQQIAQANIISERTIEEDLIQKELYLKEKEIAKTRAIEVSDIERLKAVELSEQDRAIAIAERSKAQSEAKTQADIALAEAVRAEESVITAREQEQAERQKQVELIKANKEAEKNAIGITVAAEAEKQAAEDHALAVKIKAQGESDKLRVEAEGKAIAEKLLADAAEIRYEVDAKGKQSINEANNLLSTEQIAMQVKFELINNLPGIIRESVKPMENIEGIKILQVDGFGGAGSASTGESHQEGSASLADQVVNSALRYRGQAPLLDSLLSEIGISNGDINGLTNGLNSIEK